MKKVSKTNQEVADPRVTDAYRTRLALRPSVNNTAVTAEYSAAAFGEQNVRCLI